MNRRGLIAGVLSICAAPAIVRASSLMQIKGEVAPILSDYVSTWVRYEKGEIVVAHAIRLAYGDALFHVQTGVGDREMALDIIRMHMEMRNYGLETAIRYEDNRAHPDMYFDNDLIRIH